MDGYDDYTPGTNEEIDKAIAMRSDLGNRFLILTSRTKDDLGKLGKVKETARKMMHSVEIDGFSRAAINDYCEKLLGASRANFLKEAEEVFGQMYSEQQPPLI